MKPYSIVQEPSRDSLFTDFGKATLSDRYLQKGEDFQGLFARVASRYGSDQDHAQRIYDYMSKHWFMPATPVLSNGGTKRGLPVSCLTGDMPINTYNGAKWMRDIKVGDRVLTHKGRWRKVVGIKTRESEDDLYTLKVKSRTTSVKITGNHPVLTNLGWVRVDELVKGKHWVATNRSVEFPEKEKVFHPTKINNPSVAGRFGTRELPDEIVVDEDLAWAIGLWMAEGSRGTRNGESSALRITIDDKPEDYEIAQRWIDIMDAKFDTKGSLYKGSSPNRLDLKKTNTWLNANVSGKAVAMFFEEQFGIGCKEKELPEWIMELPKPQLEAMLAGFCIGDGCKTDDGTVNVVLSNASLLSGFYNIALKLGYDVSTNYTVKGRGEKYVRRYVYSLRIHAYYNEKIQHTRAQHIKFHDGLSYYPIASLERCEENETVYDIQVEEDESFSVAGFIVHNCFLGEIQDSMSSISDKYTENLWLAAMGGGTGTYYGNIRSIGEEIAGRGKTSGIVPFIRVADAFTLAISQGALRKGSGAVYLPVDHPEIEEFTDIRRPTGGDPNRKALNIHHGVCIPDAFMKAVRDDQNWDLKSPKTGEVIRTVDARDLWIRILTARIEQGEPYLLFTDTANKAMPQFQKEAGLSIKTSNLCVAGDTPILTKEGYQPIDSLVGQDVELWNGEQWSLSRVEQTADMARLRKIVFSNGVTLWTTDEHKFYVKDGETQDIVETRAVNLKTGDSLESPNHMPQVHARLAATGDAPHAFDITVVSNGTEFKEEPTFCANEPIKHKVIFNGVYSGQCAEITLPTGIDQYGHDRTAVCCLSSLNLERWDEWKDQPNFIQDVLLFLDNVLQDFIDHAPSEMENAVYSAMRERSVGLGVMGFHSFLQSKGIPFESAMAKSWNNRIFRFIKEKADEASVALAEKFGACPDADDKGVMERFSCKTSIAPTASISIIAGGASPGIDPITANVFTQKTLSGSFVIRNKYLEKVLEKYGKNTPEVWSDIAVRKGTVQHLDFLTQDERDTFKTAFELDQRWVIEHAADRAPLVDQAQSVNVFMPGDAFKRDLHKVHFKAWEKGVKSLYYCRSTSIKRAGTHASGDVSADNVPPVTEVQVEEKDYDQCLSCQ